MNTEARRKATAAFRDKLKREGYKQLAFFLSPSAQARLDELVVTYGSKTKAVEALLGASPPASSRAPRGS